jgi:aminopeptidase N
VNDDTLWRAVLLGLNQEFFQQTVGTEALVDYMSEVVDFDVAPLAKQYLMDTRLPVLEYGFRDGQLRYRYAQVREDFAMPVDVKVGILSDEGLDSEVFSELRLVPTTRWQRLDLSEVMDLEMAGLALRAAEDESDFLALISWDLMVDPNFYVGSLEVNPGEKGVE